MISRRMRRLLVSVCCWLLPTLGHADDGILLLSSDDTRPALCTTLRIQMAASGEVMCRKVTLPAEMEARIAEASRLVRESGARIGVLVEPDTAPELVRMMIVGKAPDEALLKVTRIQGRDHPDIDRALALKAVEAHDVVRYVETTREADPAPLAASLSAPHGATAPQERSIHLLASLAGGVALGPSSLGALSLSAGLGHVRRESRLEAAVRASLVTRDREARGPLHIDVREWSLGVEARGLRQTPRLAFGGFVGAQLAVLDALARDDLGAEGRATRRAPHASLGGDLRLRLWKGLWLRADPAIDIALRRERFAIADGLVADRGRFRFVATLGLLMEVP